MLGGLGGGGRLGGFAGAEFPLEAFAALGIGGGAMLGGLGAAGIGGGPELACASPSFAAGGRGGLLADAPEVEESARFDTGRGGFGASAMLSVRVSTWCRVRSRKHAARTEQQRICAY
jgi:hypothetical protein